jgi:hypothetical protein
LPSLRPGDGFATVIGLAVPDEQVEQVDLEERVLRIAPLSRGCDPVIDLAANPPEGSRIRSMIVASKRDLGHTMQCRS